MADLYNPTMWQPLVMPKSKIWKPWTIASNSGYCRPFSSPLPEGYFPAKAISLTAEFSNTYTCISAADLLTGEVGAIAASMGSPTILFMPMFTYGNISIRRTGGYGTLGTNQRWYSAAAPRYGYSIGNVYKHQAYFGIDAILLGMTVMFQIRWLQGGTAGIMFIEFCSNCRLRKLYVSQGKVLAVRFERDDQSTKMFVKIHDKEIPPPPGLNVSATVYSKKGDGVVLETISGTLTNGWEISTTASGTYIQEGDFFKLSMPLYCEDPALIHDFNLKEGPGGVLHTNAQHYSGDTKIIGFWEQIQDPNIGTAWAAVVTSDTDKELVTLPSSLGESKRNKESMEFGSGSFGEVTSSGASTARLIMSVSGGPYAQNFCAGNLVGEFLEIEGKHYEIVDHPRGDTVSISLYSAEDGEQLSSIPSEAKLLQQNFWLTSEVFVGFTGGGSSRLYRSASAVKGSYSKTQGTTTFSWNSIPPFASPDRETFVMKQAEQDRWGVRTLTERHLLDIGAPGGVKAYQKFERWHVVDGKRKYKAVPGKISVDNSSVKAEVYGGSENDDSSGLVAITYDEPYDTNSVYGQYTVAAQFLPALDSMGTWNLYMNGVYHGGQYIFPKNLSDENQFSIVDNCYTVQYATPGHPSVGLGNPFVYISTIPGVGEGLGYIEDPLTQCPYVFFSDPEYSYLAYRTAFDIDWTEQREQGLVRIGYYENETNAASDSFVTGMEISGIATVDGDNNIYWIKIPQVIYNSESTFFSTKITGAGGVDTPLYRAYELTKEPVANGIRLPFEVYPKTSISSGGGVAGGGRGKIFSPAYFPVKDGLEGVSLSKVTKSMAKNALKGSSGGGGTGGNVNFQITPSTGLVLAVGCKDAFAMENGVIGLLYGQLLLDSDLIETDLGNKSCMALSIITTENHAYEWGAPRMDKPKTKSEEWSLPLFLMHDFEYAAGLFRDDIHEVFAFGCIYEQGDENYNKKEALSLAAYRVSLPDLTKTQETTDTIKIHDNRTGNAIGQFRKSKFADLYGRSCISSSGSGESLNESFAKVISYSSDFPLEKGPIAPMWWGDSIQIFIYSALHNGIVGIGSNNMGDSWSFNTTETGDLLIYSRGEGAYPLLLSPGNFGQIDSHNLLFYIADNSLLCKRLDLTGKGSSAQEILDRYIPTVVAADVKPHKAVATTDRTGNIIVYYLSSLGSISAAISPDGGEHWETMNNW